MNALEVLHLQKRYDGQVAVDDLSFEVAEGEIFGLIGPNGAGKSSTIMMIIGLLKPDGGTIKLGGEPYDPRDPDMRSYLGIVPQELAIYPELTALQNLRLFGKLKGLRGARLRDRVDYVLDLAGLAGHADQTPSTFSGGMSRRLNFGIALLHEPRFVLLDEPTVGIDPQSRTNLLDGVRQLSRQGRGVLYASHYMEEVEAVCHRVGIIDHGRLLTQGALDQLLDRTCRDLCITVGAVPADLAEKLKDHADLRPDHDGNTRISVREKMGREHEAHPGRFHLVLELLERASVPVLQIGSQEQSLETLFLSLTGRKLRD